VYGLIGPALSLEGVPAAAVLFLRALDSNRRRIAAEAQLSGSELRALSRIAETGSMTPRQLADAIEMTTGAITAIADGLVARDLVTRVAHPSDRRSLYLELTPAANELMSRIYQEFSGAITGALHGISEADRAQLESLLTRVGEALVARDAPDAAVN